MIFRANIQQIYKIYLNVASATVKISFIEFSLSKIESHQIIKIFKMRVFLHKFFEDLSFGHHFDLEVFNITLVNDLNGKIMDLGFKMIEKFPAYLIKLNFGRIGREKDRNLVLPGFYQFE